MTKFSILIIFLIGPFLINGQVTIESEIIFEQNAFDFFVDSLLNKKEPFIDKTAYFDGYVDSLVSPIYRAILLKYPKDKEIRKWHELNRDYQYKEQIQLQVKNQIRPFSELKNLGYKEKRNKIKVHINQVKKIEERNFVRFRTWIMNDGAKGYDMYFILNNQGRVIDYTCQYFIF